MIALVNRLEICRYLHVPIINHSFTIVTTNIMVTGTALRTKLIDLAVLIVTCIHGIIQALDTSVFVGFCMCCKFKYILTSGRIVHEFNMATNIARAIFTCIISFRMFNIVIFELFHVSICILPGCPCSSLLGYCHVSC